MSPSCEFYSNLHGYKDQLLIEEVKKWETASPSDNTDKFYCETKTSDGIIFHGWLICTTDQNTSPRSFGQAGLFIPFALNNAPQTLIMWAKMNKGLLQDDTEKIQTSRIHPQLIINRDPQNAFGAFMICRQSLGKSMSQGNGVFKISRLAQETAWREKAKALFLNPDSLKIASMLGFIDTLSESFGLQITPVDASLIQTQP